MNGFGDHTIDLTTARVVFFPMTGAEWTAITNNGTFPKHIDFRCGDCGQPNNGRVVAEMKRENDKVLWVFCSCPKEAPAVLIQQNGQTKSQFPDAREFSAGERWPLELSQLFDEASRCFAAGAYTAAAMIARKVLMACACEEGAKEGLYFADYVDYITTTVLPIPKAKATIDQIRTIGNDANHKVQFVDRESAHRAMEIVRRMLDAVYTLRSA